MASTNPQLERKGQPLDALAPWSPLAQSSVGKLALVVDHLNIVYKVFGVKSDSETARHRASHSLTDRLLVRGTRGRAVTTRIHAVKDISFVAKHGESIGIIGINGSGKSTLLKAIAGLLPPDTGTVYTAGEPSLLGVNAALIGDLTGEENIIIGGLALGLSHQEIRSRVREIADFAGLGDFVNLPMKTYSSGMGARLRFAISTAAVPDILMIDEALATGDAEFKARSKQRIDEIRDQAGTVFLVSHSMTTIANMCSRVLWINDGYLIADGDPDEVCSAYLEFVKFLKAARLKARSAKAKTANAEAAATPAPGEPAKPRRAAI
jgi:teichoic acid transport system ATP-binding protein